MILNSNIPAMFHGRVADQHKSHLSQEHEDRSSSEGGSQLPSRPLRNRDHDQLIWRWNSFTGDDREWNKQIRNGNCRKKPKTTTSSTLETVQGNPLLKQDRNEHQVRCHLLRRSRYRIINGNGSTLNQESSTKIVQKYRNR